jgi:16S rRNA (cytosine1402-N4)-methyltransferase
MAKVSFLPADKSTSGHWPVLVEEVLEHLSVRPGGRYLDGTLGLGGHASALLDKAGPGAELLGLDRDARALALARQRLAGYGSYVHIEQSSFADFETVLADLGWNYLDGALVDLGVSSLQLDTPERGFSFLRDGPLDMRMNPDGGGKSAADLVNHLPVKRLEEIIKLYGEEPLAGPIARGIEAVRVEKYIANTLELAGIVERAYPAKWRARARNHPATRTFQALRLEVNGELEQLSLFLKRIVPCLAPGGRVGVISFHSLEDRMVKNFFKLAGTDCVCPPHSLRCGCGHEASLKVLTQKALMPSAEEIRGNPRARSAKLRVAERVPGKKGREATEWGWKG